MNEQPYRPLNLPPPSVAFPFASEFSACKKLLHMIKHEIFTGRSDLPIQVDHVVLLETVKAINLFEAILHLSLDGFGRPSEMLLRPMFEAVVTASWARNHRSDVENRYPLHRQYLINLWAAARRESGLYGDIGAPDALSDADHRQAVAWFGQHGQRGWTGSTFRDMAEEFVSQAERHDAVQFARYLKLVQPFVNWMLHSSGLTFYRMISFEEEGPTVVIGPSDVGIRDSMDMGWNMAVIATGIYADHFGRELDREFSRTCFDVWAAFKGPEAMSRLGRNDPCPCHSGLKFKHCHDTLRH
jgi:hypothetical protein